MAREDNIYIYITKKIDYLIIRLKGSKPMDNLKKKKMFVDIPSL